MPRSIRVIAVGSFLLTAAAPPIAVQRATDPLRGLDTYIENARQAWGVAGLAVAIVQSDSVIYAKGFGFKDASKPDKVDERTRFAIGSNMFPSCPPTPIAASAPPNSGCWSTPFSRSPNWSRASSAIRTP